VAAKSVAAALHPSKNKALRLLEKWQSASLNPGSVPVGVEGLVVAARAIQRVRENPDLVGQDLSISETNTQFHGYVSLNSV
jgi:hypothetical protein